jgi:hypothetical protein
LHLALEIILRVAELLVARGNEVALVLPQLRAVFAVAIGERRLVSCPDLAVEPRQIGIGADRFLDRAMRRAAIESRQHRTVAAGRKAPVAFLARIGEVLRGLVELRIDAQRLLIIGNGAIEIALLAIGGAAIVVGERKSRIERDGAIVIGDGAVIVAALVIVGVAAIGQEIRLRLELDRFVIVGDGAVIESSGLSRSASL